MTSSTLRSQLGAASCTATLYYQSTSKAYIEFLKNEINGTASTLSKPGVAGDPAYLAQSDPFFTGLKGWGNAIYDLWLHNGGAAPIAMASFSNAAPPPPPAITVDPPTNVTATAGRRSIALAWKAPATTVTGYRVYGFAGGKYSLLATTASLTWTHKSLVTGQSYSYVITSYRTVDGKTYESAYSTQVTATAK